MLSELDAQRDVSASAPKPAPLITIKKRADFLAIGKYGKRFSCPYFVLITKKRPDNSSDESRCGFTVSKKVSKKAVTRNRIKRRLREACRANIAAHGTAGFDYVVIARQAAETAPFEQLNERLRFGLKWLHKNTQNKTPKAD